MKRAGALILGLFILSFLVVPVKGAQILYVSFDGLRFTTLLDEEKEVATIGSSTVGWVSTSFSATLSIAPRYVNGFLVEGKFVLDDDGDTVAGEGAVANIRVKINGEVVGSGDSKLVIEGRTVSFRYMIPVYNFSGSSLTISVEAYRSGTYAGGALHVYLSRIVVATSTEDIPLRTSVEKYIPPGAADTERGLFLNHTEVLLDSEEMGSGTLSFWLKWDGKDVTILKNGSTTVVGINSEKLLFVNTTSDVYTFPSTLPLGVYVPIYVGWSSSGEGYIIVNSTKLLINWRGVLAFDRLGDIEDESMTIIDEIKIWDTYIPPDQVVYESQKKGYILLWRGKAITITPEAGTDLGILNVAFLDENITTINSTTLSAGSKLAVVPNETALVVISRSGVSRRYWLGNYTEIAFPAENVQLVSSTISIRPTVWQYLTLKTPDGRVATRVKLDSTQTASVMAVLGSDYIISLENGNTTKSMLYTITGDISLWVENDTAKYQGKYFTTQLDDKNKLLIITYYDQSAETKELHISIRAYDANNNLKYEIDDIAVEGPVAYYRLALPVSADVMLYKVIVNADGHIYERTVFGEAGGGSVLPSNIVPSGLVIFGAGVIGALMFVAINAYLMPFGALIALSAVKFLGWANVSPYVIGMLGVFSALAMLMYRRDQGVG